MNFDEEAYSWKPDVDYKKHPELYRVGRGEQGVLICEPYKSEIGQFWRFKTKAIAEESSSFRKYCVRKSSKYACETGEIASVATRGWLIRIGLGWERFLDFLI
nr:DUF4385 family protein [Dyadobacter soli]